jgi:hypothetical protein
MLSFGSTKPQQMSQEADTSEIIVSIDYNSSLVKKKHDA